MKFIILVNLAFTFVTNQIFFISLRILFDFGDRMVELGAFGDTWVGNEDCFKMVDLSVADDDEAGLVELGDVAFVFSRADGAVNPVNVRLIVCQFFILCSFVIRENFFKFIFHIFHF